jgi:two-component system, response regulator, stage 0 sporulation protein F
MHDVPRHLEGSLGLFEFTSEVELDPPRVVVAIEDRELRRRVVFGLRADGYDVLSFRTRPALVRHLGSSAVWTEQRRPPDLVLFDDDAASPIGPQVLDALGRYELPIPFIVVTASRREAEEPAVQRLGAAAVFARPFDLDDLRTAVANITPAAAP